MTQRSHTCKNYAARMWSGRAREYYASKSGDWKLPLWKNNQSKIKDLTFKKKPNLPHGHAVCSPSSFYCPKFGRGFSEASWSCGMPAWPNDVAYVGAPAAGDL